MRTLVAFLVLILIAPTVLAHDFVAGNLQITHPWMRATPPGATVGGGYLEIFNTGAVADRLLSVEINISLVGTVHETVIENGISRMQPLPNGLPIPAGATVALRPLGLHIMFQDLTAPLIAGTTIDGVLVFENAGAVPIVFNVEPIGAMPPPVAHH